MQLTQHQEAFMEWLRGYDTALYEAATVQLQNAFANNTTVNALGAFNQGAPVEKSGWDKFTETFTQGFNFVKDTASKVVPMYDKYKANRATVKAQLRRVEQGLPPVPTKPANPRPLAERQAKALKFFTAVADEQRRQQRQKPGFDISLTPTGQRIAAVLPWAGFGFAIWALTRKKTAR